MLINTMIRYALLPPLPPLFLSRHLPILALALTTLQHLASNGANMGALKAPDVKNRLTGLAQTLHDEPVVVRAVDAIERARRAAPHPTARRHPSECTGRV